MDELAEHIEDLGERKETYEKYLLEEEKSKKL